MAKWTNAVITDQGKALMSKTMSGGTFTITKVNVGTGTVDIVNLRKQTELVSEKQTLSIVSISSDNEVTKISVILSSDNLESSYKLQQIGFYANDPEIGEILFAIAQDIDGSIIPSKTEMPLYSINFQFYFTIENDKSMAVTVDSNSFVTNAMLQEEAKKRADADKELSKVEKSETNGNIILNGEETPVYKLKEITGTLTSGETTLTLNDENIKSNSTVDTYTSVYGVNPKTVELSDGSITMTFKAQESDVYVKVVIR